jgi:hypothetical protein
MQCPFAFKARFKAEAYAGTEIADRCEALSPIVVEQIAASARASRVENAAVSGGVLLLVDEVDTPQFTPAEIAALVNETHRLRKMCGGMAGCSRVSAA